MLWSEVRGEGSPAVVFEAGGGEDSSVWSALEPEVRAEASAHHVMHGRPEVVLDAVARIVAKVRLG